MTAQAGAAPRTGAAQGVEAGGARILGPLASLLKTGEIDDAHIVAADRWHRDWVMGVEGACDPDLPRTGKAPDLHAAMLSRVAASARCTEVRRCLGRGAEARLRLILIEELSFTEIGRRLMPGDANSRRKIAAQTVILLEMLAEHYQAREERRSEPQQYV